MLSLLLPSAQDGVWNECCECKVCLTVDGCLRVLLLSLSTGVHCMCPI
jgi:hypothetical protein